MALNPKNIIFMLESHFESYSSLSNYLPIETEIAKSFISTIERCIKNDEEIEISEDLVFDENANYLRKKENENESDFDEDPDECQNEDIESICGSEKSSMLRRCEKSMKDRTDTLKIIDKEVVEHFQHKFEMNLSLSDLILRKWALIANTKLGDNKIMGFQVSKTWINKFKKRHRIVSRKITKFILKKHFVNYENVKQETATFVERIKEIFGEDNFSDRDLINADQSGFQLEMHAKRTLAPMGMKIVECVVQSVESTTHSYTVIPVITASGQLLSPLFIVIAERSVKFPKKKEFSRQKTFTLWLIQVIL